MSGVIKVENLGKKYIIGHQKQRGGATLRDTMTHTARGIWQRVRHPLSPNRESIDLEELWALKDVNFEVQQGERLGIIGPNGAGKSTLLKILSRITEPTTGKVRIKGRVSSLLEVGTGFHPELTGRENIFLNGAILGMKRQETKRNFDEIVAFAELEKFLDTPVKRYSSGMYVRLAFAVAAHLEPEILIVDEVLAVGDASFQKKCLGKMENVAGEGRTVLFVSHNMAAVTRLCKRAIFLNDGCVAYAGVTDKVVKFYVKSDIGTPTIRAWDKRSKSPGNNIVRLIEVRVHTEDGKVCDNFDITKRIGITMDYEVLQDGHVFTHGCNLFNEQGVHILSSHDIVSGLSKVPRNKGYYSSKVWIPANFLSEGIVTVGVAIFKEDPFRIHFHETNAVAFNVVDNINGNSARGDYTGRLPGIVRPIFEWHTSKK